jgi:hypothetical protein
MRTAVFLWLCWCVYFNCAGWVLSAAHELNFFGYALAACLGIAALLGWRKKTSAKIFPTANCQKLRRRSRRPLPAVFMLVAALVFLGGVLYAPGNYDALTYRLPRMLNWLAAGHWIWIPTANDRMNYSATAWEWTAMPIFALLRSDRGLFLINAIGFLLMPGLLFSVFRQLGVTRRVAWTWMWILPLAYGYVTQAGGIGNDFAGTLFGLISIYYGLRARRSQDVQNVWLAALAAALMTGVKLSNLPLLLPCLVAVWPALPRLRERWTAGVAVMAAAVLISAAPVMALNRLHTGSWSGDPKNLFHLQIKNPAAAFLGNGILLLQQSFMPPVLPEARAVNDWLNEKMPGPWRRTLEEKFPRYYLNHLNELPQEETAGLGLGVTLLLLAAIVGAIGGFIREKSLKKISPVALVAWISVLFYMSKMGSESTARLLLPYYPLVIVPILLLPVQERLLHMRAWKFFVVLAALSVLPAVILSPSRPLWPALSASGWLVRHYPGKPAAQRMAAVYFAYAHRNDALAPLRAGLPDGVLKIGILAGGNDADYSLWRPFGLRQVEYLQTGDDQSINIPDGLEWIVVKRVAWAEATSVPLETWAARHHAKITLSVPIVTLVGWGEQTWCVLHVEKP